MKRTKILLRSICLLSAIIMFCTTAGNVFAGSITDAQKEKEDLKGQLSEAQELIDRLSGSKEDVQANIQALDKKLTEISEQIMALESQLLEKEGQITDTQEELLKAQADVENQYESMKLRIRFMYENSTQSYLEVLLSSGSFADFLNRVDYIHQISRYDRDMLTKYQETVTAVTQLETTLENELAELAKLKDQVGQEQEAVAALVNEKENQLAQIGEDLTDAQQLAQAYEAEIQAQDEIIAMIQQEEAKKQEEEARRAEEQRKAEEEKQAQEEQNQEGESDSEEGEETPEEDPDKEEEKPEVPEKEPSYTGGAFTWPCPSSTRVTSDYGPRESPTAGASSYHRGLDIGAAYGSDIVAAAAGTVSFAGYSSSAGNYITVSHGNGIYTVYMHCSSIVATTGEGVTAGQVIAKVGSTGISTGNHLHFGVSLNGSYVNPWDYLR